jgi:hypothetical protein
VEQADQLLDPLVAALGRYTLAAAKIHADDTPVPVLQPGRGKTKTGRLWVYVRDDRPTDRIERASCGLVPVHAGPKGRIPTAAPAAIPGHPSG